MGDEMTSVEFFERHAGFSYGAGETPEQGRHRCAIELTRAEEWAQVARVQFDWFDDWAIGSHVEEFDAYDEEPKNCETCVARLGSTVLASLGCIDDADEHYRRVIEAELASEALYEVNRTLLTFA
jgi:hypothetical protein